MSDDIKEIPDMNNGEDLGISEEESEKIILEALQPVILRISKLEQSMDQLAESIENLKELTRHIPPQVRQLGNRVDGITDSISEPRIRDLLGTFLVLYDLLDQMIRSSKKEDEKAGNYKVLQDQVLQALKLNGILPITSIDTFDPALHKAIDVVSCESESEDGEIHEVYRTGFKTGQSILRFTEVVVKRYQPIMGGEGE